MQQSMEIPHQIVNSPARRMISFVLPVYDEEGSLKELYKQITGVMSDRDDDYELLFVDDGSTDGSFRILTELHESDPRVRVVRFRRNFGKAAAYSAGFSHARGEIVITMDTDLQDDPKEIPLFVEKIDEGFDMVVGWKYEGKGNLEKSLPSKFFNRVVRRMTGIELHDFNCPFKAYRREVLKEIHVYGELHRYIPVLAHSRGFSLAEIKIKNLPRVAGQSKYGFERYLRGLLDLMTISFITRYVKRPMHLLGISGLLACLLGGGALAFLVTTGFLFELNVLTDSAWRFRDRPLMTLGVMLLVVGIQFFSLGLLGELLVTKTTRPDGEEQGYSIRQVLEEQAGEWPNDED